MDKINMHYWAVTLIVIALIAATFGYGILYDKAATTAKAVCFIAVALALIAIIISIRERQRIRKLRSAH